MTRDSVHGQASAPLRFEAGRSGQWAAMPNKIWRGLAAGAAAGAAGTTALNAATYADMLIRGRPSSDAPNEAIEKIAAESGITIPGDGSTRENRLSGGGALAGILVGVAVGTGYGVARELGWRPPVMAGALATGTAAMAVTDGPMVTLGVADPSGWSGSDWASDVVPHAVYGLATACTYALLDGGRR
jgi:hypothetical protein